MMPFDNRARLEGIYEHRYTPRGQVGDPCVYCGATSESMDHIPPLRMCEVAVEAETDEGLPFIKVPACMECNRTLQGRPIIPIVDRRKHVKEYLRRKYAKVLKMPRWDEDELADVSEFMAQNIRAASNLSDHIKQRLAWRR